jgi:Zn-dependent protease with chaperone function
MIARIALALLLLACLCAAPAPAGEAEWRASFDAGREANYAGDQDGAITWFRGALKEAESFGHEDSRFLDTLDYLAGLYYGRGRHDEARALYARALEILNRLHGPDHPDAVMAARKLAAVSAAMEEGAPRARVPGFPLAAPERGPGPERAAPVRPLEASPETVDFSGPTSESEWVFDPGRYRAVAPSDPTPYALEDESTTPGGGAVRITGAGLQDWGPSTSAPLNLTGGLPDRTVNGSDGSGPPQVLWWAAAAFGLFLMLWLTTRRMAARGQGLDTLALEANQLLERSPTSYKVRVVLLAALGYLYLVGLMLLALAGLGAFAFGLTFGVGAALILLKTKLFIPLLILLGVLIRALWVRLPPPEGLELRRADFPELFSVIEDVRRRVSGPRIHTVLLVQKNYLILGLPLLLALSRDQVKSIVAHEYGHLSGAHARIGAWVYRVRQTWIRLMQAFDQSQHWGKGLVQRFLDWYAPYFNSYSFALARSNEYQADAIAAEVTSPRDTAAALVTTAIQCRHLDEAHWCPLFERAAHEPEPPVNAFSSLREKLREPIAPKTAEGYMDQAMALETTGEDTHPSLSDRLDALDEPAQLSDPIPRNAAEELLGSHLAPLIAHADAGWCSSVAQGWQERHEQVEEAAEKLQHIEEGFDPESADEEAHWERACLIEVVHGADQALPAYRAVLDVDEFHAGANFAVGRIMLLGEDREGLALLDRAMRADIEAVLPGCELLYRFHVENGDQAAARKCLDRAREHQRRLEAASAERQFLTPKDVYHEHGLDAAALEELRAQLAKLPFVKRAWLVRKTVKTFPERPFYVLFFERKQREALFTSTVTLTQRLVEFVRFPGDTIVVESVDRARRLARRAAAVAGSAIY